MNLRGFFGVLEFCGFALRSQRVLLCLAIRLLAFLQKAQNDNISPSLHTL